jgi:PKD repeat protein
MKKIALILIATVLSTWAIAQSQCVAGFTYSANGTSVAFTNTSSGQIDWSSWDFGDGNTSNATDPNHTYASAGTYLVCLSYIDSLIGCSDTYCDTITVSGSGGGGCTSQFALNSNGTTITGTNQSSADYFEWYVWLPSGSVDGPYYTTDLNYNAAQTGNYTVCLNAFDSIQGWCDSTCANVFIQQGGGGCSAQFNLSNNGTTITGTNQSSADYFEWYVWLPNGNADGPYYTTDLNYNAAQTGNYTVCLSAYDSLQGWCDSTCASVFIQQGGGGCSAQFSLSSNGSSITGTNQGSADYFEWYVWLPNGNADGPYYTTDLNYNAAATGNYTICLNAFDSIQGWCDSTCATVFIQLGGGGCNASFSSFVDTSGQFGDSWYFPNTSTGTGLIYSWDFGDGNTSAQQTPYHTYSAPGNYLVCLTITSQVDSFCNDTYCDSITVLTVGQLEMIGSQSELQLYPNPVANNATVQLNVHREGQITLSVYDAVGQLAHRETVNVNSGDNSIQLNTSNLRAGVYLLEATAEDARVVTRFIKR